METIFYLITVFCLLSVELSSFPYNKPTIDNLQSLTIYLDALRYKYPLPEKILDEYDFIIVGAGSAGSVLTNRLTEIRDWNVLLIEAGEAESILSDVPLLSKMLKQTNYAWQFKMEPEPNICLADEDKLCYARVGKSIGGSSSINNMIYTRGLKKDWDGIAAAGNKGWSFKEVFPYFLKLERANTNDTNTTLSDKGYLGTDTVNYKTNYGKAFLSAAKDLGYQLADMNNNEVGFNYIKYNAIKGVRNSASKRFLYPFKNRENMHILPNSRVTKVLIDERKQAVGVEFVRNKKKYTIKCKKEIILTAGALMTPQILMLSGIGPSEHLQKFNISVVQDLKVGRNLGDHLNAEVVFRTDTYDRVQEEDITLILQLKRWLKSNEGVWTLSGGGVEAIGLINTETGPRERESVDAAISLVPLRPDSVMKRGEKLSDYFRILYGPLDDYYAFTLTPTLLDVKSKGSVELRTANPFKWPVIRRNYFADEEDMKKFVKIIRIVQRFESTETFNNIGAKVFYPNFPDCLRMKVDSDEYWQCAIRSTMTNGNNYVGTCKMGPDDDRDAVVDSKLRVRGVSKLRVADASVIPNVLSAYTAAPVMVIAEKAADMIVEANNN